MGCGQFSLIDHNEKFVSNCSEEHEDDSKRAREYSPSRHDLTRDYQQNTISLEGKVISVYITLTPTAARNPQIISSFVRQSKSLFHDIFFSEIPSMIMLPLHKKRKLYLLSLLWVQGTSKASGRESAHSLFSVKIIECMPS